MSWTPDYPRTVPERRPPGHRPRAPRWTLGFDAPLSLVTSDYLALQCAGPDDPAVGPFLERVRACHTGRDGADAPEAWELLSFTDEAGRHNLVHLGYWRDATAHARWLATAPLPRWFAELDAAAVPFGAWHEVVQVPLDRVETIYSDPRRAFGLAACPGTRRESMTVNGYFGAARDRLPLSAIDPLEAAGPHRRRARPAASEGRRLRAECGHNTAVIRSGQYWQQAEGEQLADYTEALEPKLMAGMAHLREAADAEGTLSLRVMTSLDRETLRPLRETSVLGHFHTLAALEGWAAGHATHAAIYEHAIAKNRQYGEARTVVTWHEVFVLPRTAAFAYVNCHPATGILPYATSVLAVEPDGPAGDSPAAYGG
ncbi:phenylacetaldoxime dehydratase family protein [Streptomyces albidoflavus]|uniref:phenylacetaldoxime dehydratase family protein n=1 Tax=Streptomyces albidoflavus TaxID=1886 RepID=UPI0010220D87|nr:phenylacetaldoxime dehydratase family protein [Streptomyces albidoflavus]NEC98363.1 phenylacetaldoxime dehydratase family protein [Streptomyces albidoflavus]RZD71271.1 phenylacetaldoxime dehydratase [Streptomyces albidoflavus]WSD42446.1 phenylacetaldoxime dehydratase family protein [Streptomyces albidoflavus]